MRLPRSRPAPGPIVTLSLLLLGLAAGFAAAADPPLVLYEIYLVEADEPVVATTGDSVVQAARGQLDGLVDLPGIPAGASLGEILGAAEKAGVLRILQAPRQLTRIGERVTAETGLQVPVWTIDSEQVTAQYVSANLSIVVNGRLEADGSLTLEVSYFSRSPRLDRLAKEGAVNPPIVMTEQWAELVIANGGTAVLGGIRTALNGETYRPAAELVLLVRAQRVEL